MTAGKRQPRRDTAIFVATLALTNLSTYGLHMIMTRRLGPVDYGAFGALLGILVIASVPIGALQAVVARRIAVAGDDHVEARVVLRSAIRLCATAGAVIATVGLAASPLLARFLRVETLDMAIALGGLMIPLLMTPAGRGALQGRSRFPMLGASMLTSMGMRLAIGATLVSAGMGARGAIIGVVLGDLCGLIVTFLPIRSMLAGGRSSPDYIRSLIRDGAQAATAMAAFWTLVSIDVVLARHLLPEIAAGHYAAASVVGKSVLYLPGAVAMLVFPRLAERPHGAEARRTLVRATGLVAAIGLACTIGINLFPGLVSIAFGSEFVEASRAAALLALAMSCFGIVSILLYHCLALGRVPLRAMVAAVAVEVAVVFAFHGSPATIATALLGVGIALVIVFASRAARQTRIVRLVEGPLWSEPDESIDLSVITPVYNGGATVVPNLLALLETLDASGVRSEVILVSDGSTDGAIDAVRALGEQRVRVLHYDQNKGKGFALRTGMANATGMNVAFIDSDGDLNPEDLVRFMQLMPMYGADLVVGSKRHPLSHVHYPRARRIMSWGYHKLVRVMFGVKVSDTQTGIKLVRREALAEVLPLMVEKRFAFDLELIVALRRAGHKRILEAPVNLDFKFSSTISKRAAFAVLKDTLAIWHRRYIVRQYDHDQPIIEPQPASAVEPSLVAEPSVSK